MNVCSLSPVQFSVGIQQKGDLWEKSIMSCKRKKVPPALSKECLSMYTSRCFVSAKYEYIVTFDNHQLKKNVHIVIRNSKSPFLSRLSVGESLSRSASSLKNNTTNQKSALNVYLTSVDVKLDKPARPPSPFPNSNLRLSF